MKYSVKDKGDLVEEIQSALIRSGFDAGKIDGEFGQKTEAAVKALQKEMNLKVDGVVGLITATALSIGEILLVPEKGRRNFSELLTVNPNYFGNLPDSHFEVVELIQSNDSYEAISCIGYSPSLKHLEATVQQKRPYGYGGNLCSDGSMEYVRFYIDYGSGWQDLGSVAFNAHDIPEGNDCAKADDHPLSFSLTIPIEPPLKFCAFTLLPKVRAILSWQVEPPAGDPNWLPVWGSVLERSIQIEAFKLPIFPIWPLTLQEVEIPQVSEDMAITPSTVAVSMVDKDNIKEYLEKDVEPERMVYTEVAQLVNNTKAALTPKALESKYQLLQKYDLDISKLIPKLTLLWSNVNYEQLTCLGLDYNREWLEATVHIKRPAGYSGGPCTAGSVEYVAFWADWDDECEWTYLNTVTINVHDYANIPADGLHYAAILPVDLNAIRRSCSEPKIARVRAVLSWNSPPSTTNPHQMPTYGNRLDRHVLIRPGEEIPDGAYLSIIGGVGVSEIDTAGNGKTLPFAHMVPWGSYADPHDTSRQCPFGGLITLSAPKPLDPIFTKYKIYVREQGSVAETVVTSKVPIVNADGDFSWHYPDSNGYFTYLDVYSNVQSLLGRWFTGSGQDGVWEVRLEASNASETITDSTPWYKVALDNSLPTAELTVTGGDCQTYVQGDTISGKFVARDDNFGHYKLATTPSSLSPPQPIPSYGTSATPQVGSDWDVVTSANTPACGYVITLRVWDRTIVNSHPNSHNHRKDDTGLCLKQS